MSKQYGITNDTNRYQEDMELLLGIGEKEIQDKEEEELPLDNLDSIEEISEEIPTKESKVEEEEEEEEEKPEPIDEKELLREKLYLEKKRRKSLYAEREQLVKENKRLQEAFNGTVDLNKDLYSANLYNDLKKVKEIKRQALMGEDPDLVVEVDEIQQKILLRIHDFENRQVEYQSNQEDIEPEEQEGYTQEQLQTAQEWLEENPEISEGTDEYDPKIQKDVHKFVDKLDKELKKAGRGDVILSDGYFQFIDKYISKIKRNVDTDGYSKSNVGGIRNNFAPTTTGTIKVELTKEDKRIIDQLNLSEKDYLRSKIERIKNEKNKRK